MTVADVSGCWPGEPYVGQVAISSVNQSLNCCDYCHIMADMQ